MEIFGCTYKEYIEKYEKRLRTYKEKFEDRNESIFLEREIINFKDFHNVLVSIHNCFMKNKSYNKLINDTQFKSHLSYLQNNYNNVFNELFQIGQPLLDGSKNVSQPDDIKEEDIHGYIFYVDVTKEKLDNIITSTKRILEFIKKKHKNPQTPDILESTVNLDNNNTESIPIIPVNPYTQVFSSLEAYKLFEKLYETYKDTKTPLVDYSFIYRKMYDDGYILEYFKPGMYRNWLSKHYEIELDKLKTIHECTIDSRIQNYNTIKELLQIK